MSILVSYVFQGISFTGIGIILFVMSFSLLNIYSIYTNVSLFFTGIGNLLSFLHQSYHNFIHLICIFQEISFFLYCINTYFLLILFLLFFLLLISYYFLWINLLRVVIFKIVFCFQMKT